MSTAFAAGLNLENSQALFVWINNGLTNSILRSREIHSILKKLFMKI